MKVTTLVRLRRLSQITFLLLFLYSAEPFLRADPLSAVLNVLASGALYAGLLWSLLIIVPTVLVGRVFCGWVCPLGTLNHWVSSWRAARRGRRRMEANRYKNWHRAKDYLLVAILVLALLGSSLGGWLDPLSLLLRGMALSIRPALDHAAEALLAELYGSSWRPVRTAGDVLRFILYRTIARPEPFHFAQAPLLGLIVVAVLATNLWITRLWCRALCPLGALLGWLSRWSLLGLEKRTAHCDNCNRCLLNCQGGDDPIPGAVWHKSECHVCLNCLADCPEAGLRFRLFPSLEQTRGSPNLNRRKVVGSGVAALAALPLLKSSPARARAGERLIRPPGALDEEDFLARCVRCGRCMEVCPNNALHPAFLQGGLEGLWTPLLIPRIGYCEPSCVRCGEVCPTGAIWRFTEAQKGWGTADPGQGEKPIRIGTAFYDHGRCLPWAMGIECIVCEEWCPTSPKAIYLVPAEVRDAQGNVKRVRQPYVDPDLCVGCGACEYACPVKDRPAIYVTSIGESRSRTNQLVLGERERQTGARDPFPPTSEAEGWAKQEPVRRYPAKKLWEYIDGAADRYLAAGVVETLVADYRFGREVEARVEIYLMRSPEGAASILASEPAAGSQHLRVGDEGRLYPGSAVFRKGRALVRITLFNPCPEQAVITLARALERRIG